MLWPAIFLHSLFHSPFIVVLQAFLVIQTFIVGLSASVRWIPLDTVVETRISVVTASKITVSRVNRKLLISSANF